MVAPLIGGARTLGLGAGPLLLGQAFLLGKRQRRDDRYASDDHQRRCRRREQHAAQAQSASLGVTRRFWIRLEVIQVRAEAIERAVRLGQGSAHPDLVGTAATFVPQNGRLLELSEKHQLLAALLQPARQTIPRPYQRLVRQLEVRLADDVAHREQARLRQLQEQIGTRGAQRLFHGRLADDAPCAVRGDQAHEGCAHEIGLRRGTDHA